MKNPLTNFLRPIQAGLIALALPAAAQIPNTLLHSISAPLIRAQYGAHLGYRIAMDGSYVVAGAQWDDMGATDAGVVKVFDATSGVLLFILLNPSPTASDFFGSSVAISGTRVVVGASHDDTGAVDAGGVYIYDLASATPTVPVLTLNNPAPEVGDNFGTSVAISGTTVVAGAERDNTAASDSGCAYVYDLSSATPAIPMATLTPPSLSANAFFGNSVALFGQLLVVAANNDPIAAPGAGSVSVYDLGSPTFMVPLITLNNPTPENFDQFGSSVAISGTRVVVGTTNDNTGATDAGSAYVYDLSGGTPTVPVVTLSNPSPEIQDYFGISVAITGTRVVVGAWKDDTDMTNTGSTYVYDLDSSTPTVPVVTLNNPSPEVDDQFGCSVAVSGARVAVGAFWDNTTASNAGSVYVYNFEDSTPTVPVATLNNPGPAVNDRFGISVALAGTLMVVGAYLDDTGATDAGSVYVYDLASATPTVPVMSINNPGPQTNDQFGYSLAISGTLLVVGSPYNYSGANGSGSAYVYDLGTSSSTLPAATLNNPSPVAIDNFGWSVAISGTRVIVGAINDDTGATNSGSAYVYDMGSGTPTMPLVTLINPGPASNDSFGWSVAISGTRAVVGTWRDDTGASDSGSAYLYDLSSATPAVPMATLNNPSPSTSDQFGISVEISGTRVVVAAIRDDTGATDTGSVYVYDLTSGTPTVPMLELHNPDPSMGDLFGSSVAISGTRVVVGAQSDDAGAADTGSAYIYDIASGTPSTPIVTLNNPGPAAAGYLVTKPRPVLARTAGWLPLTLRSPA
jgi:hypothetical protein